MARPFENFFEVFNQCEDAGDAILGGVILTQFVPLLERSAVISAVTAIEVYYRDMLDFLFRYCAPAFFEPQLKHLLPDKYDIADLLTCYRHQIHPLELVSSAQSFQNVDRIDKVFSKFMEKGLWASLYALQARVKDAPEQVWTWSPDDVAGLRSIFELRHELVHNPARKSFFDRAVLERLRISAHVVYGSDIVLSNLFEKNKDPELTKEAGD